jgi:hypothetical protein
MNRKKVTFNDLKVGDSLYYYDSKAHDFDIFSVSKTEFDKYGVTIFFFKNKDEEWFCTSDLTKTKAKYNDYVTIYFNKEDLKKVVKDHIKDLEEKLNKL